eukprot:TRINITY_DN283_c0_g1_i4.p1 TRINITY_DN283_c0_g1~~TRINITY_DN283_c0_g1_i4.p1  ORF type:complete len:332 (-),score=46.96 TRINITY_DN283_c0_g1_i4:34-927(-)
MMKKTLCPGGSVDMEGEGAGGGGQGVQGLEDEMKRLHASSFYNLPVVKDLPRLVKRIQLASQNGILIGRPSLTKDKASVPLAGSGANASSQTTTTTTIAATSGGAIHPDNGEESEAPLSRILYRTLLSLSDTCETDPSIRDSIHTACDTHLQGNIQGEHINHALDKVFASLSPDDSITCRVLKTCTQETLVPGIYALRTALPELELTKDVRGALGWRIDVEVQERVISVTHRRREQGFGPVWSGFEFEYCIIVMLDRDAVNVQAVSLRVTDVTYEAGFDPKKRETLDRLLCHGNLIL